MRVSWAQFWRAGSALRIWPGNRTERRKQARTDWPPYKHARQMGEVIDETSVHEWVEKQTSTSSA